MLRLSVMMVCALPLGVLTTRVVVDEFVNDVTPNEQAQENSVLPLEPNVSPEEARKLSANIAEQAKTDRAFLETVFDFDPIGTADPPHSIPTPASPEYSLMSNSLAGLTLARKAFTDYVDLYRLPMEPKAELSALKAFKKDHDFGDLPQGKALVILVDARVRKLELSITILASLAEVEADFKARRYEECLKKLEKIQEDLKRLPDEDIEGPGVHSSISRRVAEIERVAKFHNHFTSYRQRPDDPEGELEALSRLLRTLPVPPPTEVEQSILKKHQERENTLIGLVAVLHLQKVEHVRVADYSEKALRVIRDFPERVTDVAVPFRTWLRNRLEERPEPVYDRNYMEAINAQGLVVGGVFRPGGQERPPQFYMYWKTIAAYRDKQSPATLFAKELQSPPELPLDLRCVRKYNAAIKRLQQNMDSILEWQEFAETCHELTKTLRGYQAAGNENRPISFLDEAKYAEEVQDAWDNVQLLLAKSRAAQRPH